MQRESYIPCDQIPPELCSISTCICHHLAMPIIFDSIFQEPSQKKFSLFNWFVAPLNIFFSFQESSYNQSQLFSIPVKKYLDLFVWFMHICTYASIMQCNLENKTTWARGGTPSLSPRFQFLNIFLLSTVMPILKILFL